MKSSQLGQYIDQLLETVINYTPPTGQRQNFISSLAWDVHDFKGLDTRVVIFGGGNRAFNSTWRELTAGRMAL